MEWKKKCQGVVELRSAPSIEACATFCYPSTPMFSWNWKGMICRCSTEEMCANYWYEDTTYVYRFKQVSDLPSTLGDWPHFTLVESWRSCSSYYKQSNESSKEACASFCYSKHPEPVQMGSAKFTYSWKSKACRCSLEKLCGKYQYQENNSIYRFKQAGDQPI